MGWIGLHGVREVAKQQDAENSPQINTDDFCLGVVRGIVDTPDSSSCSEIEYSLRLFDRGFVEGPFGDEKHDFVVYIQALLFNLLPSVISTIKLRLYNLVRRHKIFVRAIVGMVTTPCRVSQLANYVTSRKGVQRRSNRGMRIANLLSI